MRKQVGVLVGALFGVAALAGMAKLNLTMFHWPDFNWASAQAWGDSIAAAPLTAQAMLVGSWAIAALLGGLVAVSIAEWPGAGWIVTLLLTLTGAICALVVPQPFWMQVTTVLAPLVAGLVVSGASGAA